MHKTLKRVQHGLEGMAVILMIAMFLCFLLQIFYRYVLNSPLGWTSEACTLAYVWVVFWGGAFLLRNEDHVAFSMLRDAAPPHVKRIYTGLFCLALGGTFAVGFPQMLDFVTFMAIDRTPMLRIRFDLAYSVFILFAVAVIIRCAFGLFRAAMNQGNTT